MYIVVKVNLSIKGQLFALKKIDVESPPPLHIHCMDQFAGWLNSLFRVKFPVHLLLGSNLLCCDIFSLNIDVEYSSSLYQLTAWTYLLHGHSIMIRLDGHAHGIVTKTVLKTLQGL